MSELSALRVLLAPNPSPMTLDGTRSFVVGRERTVVIDPGPADPEHLRALGEALEGSSPVAILLTHAHPDHSAGASALREATGAPVCMARGGVRPLAEGAVDRWLSDGDRLETDAGALLAVATPGHAPEHLSFHWTGEETPAGGVLFVGDLLMGEGDTTLIAPPEGDLSAYLHSLDRVERLSPSLLYPAHGPALEDPPAVLARYRRHREERLDQLRDVLRAGEAAPHEIVQRIYGDALPRRLRSAAEGSVQALLIYLAERGEVHGTSRRRYTLASETR